MLIDEKYGPIHSKKKMLHLRKAVSAWMSGLPIDGLGLLMKKDPKG